MKKRTGLKNFPVRGVTMGNERDEFRVPEDLSSYSREQLIALKAEVDDRIRSIGGQIDDARRARAAGQAGADRDWMRRAETARRIFNRASARIATSLAALNRAEKEKGRQRSEEIRRQADLRRAEKREYLGRFEQQFIEVARRKLPPETFQEIFTEASALASASIR